MPTGCRHALLQTLAACAVHGRCVRGEAVTTRGAMQINLARYDKAAAREAELEGVRQVIDEDRAARRRPEPQSSARSSGAGE